MKKIGVFEELQPNGMIAVSSNRIMSMVSLVAAIALTVLAYYNETATKTMMVSLIEKGAIHPADVALISAVIGPGEWLLAVIFTMLSFAFGFKAYNKTKELKAMSVMATEETDEKVENQEEKNHGTMGKPA